MTKFCPEANLGKDVQTVQFLLASSVSVYTNSFDFLVVFKKNQLVYNLYDDVSSAFLLKVYVQEDQNYSSKQLS